MRQYCKGSDFSPNFNTIQKTHAFAKEKKINYQREPELLDFLQESTISYGIHTKTDTH